MFGFQFLFVTSDMHGCAETELKSKLGHNYNKTREQVTSAFGLISRIPGLLYGFFLCFSFLF